MNEQILNQNEQTERESMVFFKSFINAVRTQPKSRQLDCINAIIDYGIWGVEPKGSNPSVLGIFSVVKPSIDSAIKRYSKSSENGKKGGAPKGNQNAKKDVEETVLNNEKMQEEENNLKTTKIQPKNNQWVDFKTTKNNLTVTNTDTVTNTVTETNTDTETENNTKTVNFTERQTITENVTDTVPARTRACASGGLVSSEEFISLSQKFKKYFPHKFNEICKVNEINNLNLKEISIEQLIARVDMSDFLREAKNLGLEWCLLHYDKIISGAYDNYAPKSSSFEDDLRRVAECLIDDYNPFVDIS